MTRDQYRALLHSWMCITLKRGLWTLSLSMPLVGWYELGSHHDRAEAEAMRELFVDMWMDEVWDTAGVLVEQAA